MTLVPNVPFAAGDDWTPELAYLAFSTPVYDDQPQYLGHRERIKDDELSSAAGQIKPRLEAIEDGLKVTVRAGLSLSYNSGLVSLPDGSTLTIAAGLVAAPDNATSYVYLGATGSVLCTVALPVIRLLMAKVTTVSGSVSSLQDLRHPARKQILPVVSSIKIFGGSSSLDKVATNGEVFDQGYYYYRDFTVPPGTSITVSKFARFFCAGSVSIQGTVNVTPTANGAQGFGTGSTVDINLGGLSGAGAGGGSGSGVGASYPYAAQPYGSGGGLGFIRTGPGNSASLGTGGSGGGGIWLEAAGLVQVTGSVFAKGGDASVFASVVGTPSVSGNGGGSGGLIYISSLTAVIISAPATLDVRGGNGSNGLSAGGGGGGGGGGQVVLLSPSNNTTGSTILLSGGSKGADGSASVGIGGGSGGGFGGPGGVQAAGSVGRLIIGNYVPIGG